MNPSRTRAILGSSLVVAAAAVAGWAVTNIGATADTTPSLVTPARVVSVSGTGKVTVTPDLATVSLGAQATSSSASGALATVNDRTRALVAALKAQGVAEMDIATTSLSVYPSTDSNGRVTGFTASNQVTATIREIAKAGSVIDAATKAAGENVVVSGVSFGYADEEKVLGDARKAAVENALKRAQEYAGAANASVGKVVQISESAAVIPMSDVRASYDSAAGASKAVVMPGSQDLSMTVTVVYELN